MVFDNIRKRAGKKNLLSTNLPITPERRREKTRLSAGGDAGFGLLTRDEEEVFQTGSIASKSSRQTYGGSILETTKDDELSLRKKPSGPVRTKSGFWGFGRTPSHLAIEDQGSSFHQSIASSWNTRRGSKKKPQSTLQGGHESFDLEPSQRFFDDEDNVYYCDVLNAPQLSAHTRQTRQRSSEVESIFSDDHSDSTLSTQDQRERMAPRTPPTTAARTQRASNNFMALAHHGDWGNPGRNENLIKSPDRKPRHLDIMRRLAAPAESSSSESDDAGSYVSGATPVDNPELLEFTTDDDDDDSVGSIVISHEDDHAMIQRKVSRMSSGALRRWDGFADQVSLLVKATMPDAMDDVPKLMKQFAGREAELIQTLQNITNRSPRQRMNRNIVHKSKAIQGSRTVSALPMDAIAAIAAANVLDDNMQAVKPEFVVDEDDLAGPSESSSSGSQDYDDDQSYSDEESSEESSYDQDDDDLSSYDEDVSSSEGDQISSANESGMEERSEDEYSEEYSDDEDIVEGTIAG